MEALVLFSDVLQLGINKLPGCRFQLARRLFAMELSYDYWILRESHFRELSLAWL